MSLGLSPHEIDAPAEEPRTLSIRYSKDGSLEVRVRTAALAGLLTLLGGGALVMKPDNAASAPASEHIARLSAVEARVGTVEGELKDVKSEVRQMRLDATDDARWEASYRRDEARVRYLDRRRRELERP